MDRGNLTTAKTEIDGTPAYEENYALDRLGNWNVFAKKVNGSVTLFQARIHNAANELTTIAGLATHIAHDRAGNMTKTPTVASFSHHINLTFDAWNRLVKAKTTRRPRSRWSSTSTTASIGGCGKRPARPRRCFTTMPTGSCWRSGGKPPLESFAIHAQYIRDCVTSTILFVGFEQRR